MKPFNSDSAIEDLVKILQKDFCFDRFIETGTYYGSTAKWFRETFPEKEVHTIEKNTTYYYKAMETLANYLDLNCHFGESPEILQHILEMPGKPFFYLDAHWYDDWPLLKEIEVISQHCKDNCCIMIDDIRVPFRPFQYDKYKGQKLDLDYVLPALKEVFTEPFFFFNEKSNGNPVVGKLICFPKAWKTSLSFKEDRGYFYY